MYVCFCFNNNNNNNINIRDTYARSYIDDTAARATAAANGAAANNIPKYTELNTTHHFIPIAIETGGAWNQLAIEFISELGKKMTEVTQEPRETQFLYIYFRDSQLRYREGMRSRSEIHSQPSCNFLTTGMSFHEHLLI